MICLISYLPCPLLPDLAQKQKVLTDLSWMMFIHPSLYYLTLMVTCILYGLHNSNLMRLSLALPPTSPGSVLLYCSFYQFCYISMVFISDLQLVPCIICCWTSFIMTHHRHYSAVKLSLCGGVWACVCVWMRECVLMSLNESAVWSNSFFVLNIYREQQLIQLYFP